MSEPLDTGRRPTPPPKYLTLRCSSAAHAFVDRARLAVVHRHLRDSVDFRSHLASAAVSFTLSTNTWAMASSGSGSDGRMTQHILYSLAVLAVPDQEGQHRCVPQCDDRIADIAGARRVATRVI
jgi:hypothetical protein